MIRPVLLGICSVLGIAAASTAAPAPPRVSDTPVTIPLTVVRNPRYGTYSARIDVAIGDGKPLPFGFDTGSTGLHVFSDARLDSMAGVRCTQTPAGVTYGNPARIVLNGVVCFARLTISGVTIAAVPIAYLTSAACPAANPDCKIPNLRDARAMHGYGVFGAGLTGVTVGDGSVPNPITLLPGRRGSAYAVTLHRDGGRLVLGSAEPPGSAEFHLRDGTRPGERYGLPMGCLFVNDRPIGSCMQLSFDTGNGVPWIHAEQAGSIPQEDGLLRPGTRLGFAPPGDARQATSVVAGDSFDDRIRVLAIAGKPPLANVGIAAFFDRTVTYDNAQGIIAIAPGP